MRKIIKGIAIILAILIGIFLILFGYFVYMISPVGGDEKIMVTIPKNSTGIDVADILEEHQLIRDTNVFKIYLKIYQVNDLKQGTFELNKQMDMKEIVEALRGSGIQEEITVLFQEGINMRKVVSIITKNFPNITSNEIYTLLKDTTYLDSLMEDYWFITSDVKNNKLYYSLEGYLFPETYQYKKDSTLKEIFKKMLDQMKQVLDPYRTEIENMDYSVHEYLTLSTIIELEGLSAEDRKNIAGVFYNRLDDSMSLGSDVTTYYDAKIDNNQRDLYQSEIEANHGYNTRAAGMEGKLPIGPIGMPSASSIRAAIEPANNSYYYFVADKNRKVYFAKTYSEHIKVIKQLKEEGLWLFY